jgi:hypothetical protein
VGGNNFCFAELATGEATLVLVCSGGAEAERTSARAHLAAILEAPTQRPDTLSD